MKLDGTNLLTLLSSVWGFIFSAINSDELTSILITILTIISILFNIAYTIWKWYRNAIKDDKIDKNDVDDLMNDLNDIINKKEDE